MYKLLLQIQKALSIQAALQATIVVVVSISIADSEKADKITQELFQKSAIKQINRQKHLLKILET